MSLVRTRCTGKCGIYLNLLTCINIDEYRDALCKIGNEMHSDYRYSHSRLSRTSAVRTAAKLPFYFRLLLANNKETSPAVPMGTALGWAIIGLGLEFFGEINVQFSEIYLSHVFVLI